MEAGTCEGHAAVVCDRRPSHSGGLRTAVVPMPLAVPREAILAGRLVFGRGHIFRHTVIVRVRVIDVPDELRMVVRVRAAVMLVDDHGCLPAKQSGKRQQGHQQGLEAMRHAEFSSTAEP